MSRYLQKISLKPYSDTELWTGWELEGRSGEIEGLMLVDHLTDDEILLRYGVNEFQTIPLGYLDDKEFRPKGNA
jgi:hypothetical protein